MGRIADAALRELANGPLAAIDLGVLLRARGVTRARDPRQAVRRALRDDPRVLQIDHDLFASRAEALSGVTLTCLVSPQQAARGEIEVDPDLSPLVALGAGRCLGIPHGTPAGGLVGVRVDDHHECSVAVLRLDEVATRVDDERALVSEVRTRIAAAGNRGSGLPVVPLGPAMLALLVRHPPLFRAPGRPVSWVLAEVGLETHLGWVGAAGTDWRPLTEVEAEMLGVEVADLLAREDAAGAAELQGRLMQMCERHLPRRAASARRLFAAILDRAGCPRDAVRALAPLAGDDDPGDRYAMALALLSAGDEVAARRAVQDGLARAGGTRFAEVRACLVDLAGQLDGEASLTRLAERTPGPDAWLADPAAFARSVVGLRRSHLIEAFIEEVGDVLAGDSLIALMDALAGDGGTDAREMLAACSVVLEGPAGRIAADAVAGWHHILAAPAVRGLIDSVPAGAWATAPDDAPDQQQFVIAVARDGGRVAPFVALIDYDDLGGALKDAFFLPDMVIARLEREVFVPMADAGLPLSPVPRHDACDTIRAAATTSVAVGWQIPSERHQPVLARMRRMITGIWVSPEG